MASACSRQGSQLAVYRVDHQEVHKRGIAVPAAPNGDDSSGDTIGPAWRVANFLEKPDPSQTTSRWACPAFYCFDR